MARSDEAPDRPWWEAAAHRAGRTVIGRQLTPKTPAPAPSRSADAGTGRPSPHC
ncbi:hypothetical protein GCM10010442_11670 [Kitasatospora kifunensis]